MSGRKAHRRKPGRVLALALRADHVHHRVDERQVGERLREVAQVSARLVVELLRVEPQRAGEAEQTLAEVPRLLQLTDLDERGDEPEGADQERSLLALEAVIGLA